MDKVKWGVLSTANIGVNQVIPAMQEGDFSVIRGIASRNKDKAKQVASELGIEKSYGSYEELLADEEIDAIYNPLPNHLHTKWTIKALEAGKHVLCEKPIGMDTKDAQKLLEETKKYPGLKVMEAFMYRFHPQWTQVKSWLAKGEIGTIKSIHSEFTYFNDDPDNIRNKADIGGGGLLDIGCYCISASRYVMEAEPEQVFGEIEYDPDMKIDRLASGILKFPEATATFTCSTQASPEQSMKIFGTEGMIVMEIPFNPLTSSTRVSLYKKGKVAGAKDFKDNHYTLQGDAFSKAILEDTEVPTPLSDAISNMKVIDAVFESDEKREWVEL